MVKPVHSLLDLSATATGHPADLFPSTMECADRVHAVPDGSVLVPVEVDDQLLSAAWYDINEDGTPRRIAIHPGCVRPRLSLLHEVGHLLDHAVIDTPGTWSSPEERFEGWRGAVGESEAFARLQDLRAGPPIQELARAFDYLLRTEELFARSYAQWIAVRSQDDGLLEELGDSLVTLKYPEHWGFEDFAPIADALDTTFKELKWKE